MKLKLAGAGLSLCLVAGCAATPTPRFDQASARVAELSGETEITEKAPQALAEAQQALEAARAAEEPAEVEHLAQIALHKARIARLRVREAAAEKRIEQAERAAEQLREAARARRIEAERRAAAEREERERTRRSSRAPSEADEAEPTSALSGLDQVREQLAELNPRLTERGLILTLGEVLFGFDSASLKAYTERIMDRLADFLQRNPGYRLQIEGHTDNAGTAEYNLQLSRMRAHAVEEALTTRGVARGRITTRGFGERQPIASNDTAGGRRQNRRVEVIISQSS